MVDVASRSTVDVLRVLHGTLDAHFRVLLEGRRSLEPVAPVFALEHDLDEDTLELLLATVRAAVREGLHARHRTWWLPFAVYAAESGYDYVGDEYWPTFERATPGWRDEYRAHVKQWFLSFAKDYGGAVPAGAFASTFRIIAWPITHAVLPTYLQRQLAKLLFEFRGGLTSELLDDPAALGERLARRAASYTERFRIFCENTVLVGQVAAALLSEADEESPYLSSVTLARLVDGISREQQARLWLTSARQSARRVRTSGFRGVTAARRADLIGARLPRATDPRLFLRLDGGWKSYAELPDLTVLEVDLPDVYEQLRSRRARVAGARRPVPISGLLYGAQEVRLDSWPRDGNAFVQLDGAPATVNHILADRCTVKPGPRWLFRRQGAGLAVEVKGRFVRPGHRYVLLCRPEAEAPAVPWASRALALVEGVTAYEIAVPERVDEADEAAMRAVGIPVLSSVAIRPVGVVASGWDGEGEVEWLAGEPALVGVRSELAPRQCRVVIDGQVYLLDWPSSGTELCLALDGLGVGTHEMRVALLGDSDRTIADGYLVITIRDPQVRPEAASLGEGIRMLAAPARPTMADLWDGRASVSVVGPLGGSVALSAELLSGSEASLARVSRTVKLPVDETAWSELVKTIRAEAAFKAAYDEAESCVVTASLGGVGFAALTVERGFQPLRWRFSRGRRGEVLATLVDRTDGSDTSVEFFDVETPLSPTTEAPREPLAVPPRGGLAIATSGAATAATVLPTDPNKLLRMAPARPAVSANGRSVPAVLRLARAHRLWNSADLPADAFAAHQQLIVSEAIARAIATLLGGARWAHLERTIADARDDADYLDEMQDAVGSSEAQRALAKDVAYSLHGWLGPAQLISGFAEVIEPSLRAAGITGRPTAAKFLLTLAGRPGHVADWSKEEASFFIERIVHSPVIFRAARFAVLGTRAINDVDGLDRGF